MRWLCAPPTAAAWAVLRGLPFSGLLGLVPLLSPPVAVLRWLGSSLPHLPLPHSASCAA